MIRYGQDGQINPIFAAAAAIGQGNAAPSTDQQMNSILGYNAQMRQLAQTNTYGAQQLQLAQQQQQGRSPTMGASLMNGSPLVSSINSAKKLARSTTLAGVDLTPDQNQQLSVLEQDPTMSLNEYQDITGRIAAANTQQTKEADKTKKEDENAQGKAKLALEAFKVLSSPEDKALIKALALSKSSTIDDVRMAIAQSQSRSAGETRQTTQIQQQQQQQQKQQEFSTAESDRRSAREESEKLAADLRTNGIDPDGPATQEGIAGKSTTPWYDYVLPGDQSYQKGGLVNKSSGTVDASSPEMLKYQRYQQLKQQMGAGSGGGGKLDAHLAAQFLQQAGGDKDKARQLARNAGYSF